MRVTAAVKKQVESKLKEGIKLFESHYNKKMKMPTVKYTVRGGTAGWADYQKWTVNFNPVLLMENLDDFIERTVPHELAHLGTDLVYPEAHRPGLNGLANFPSVYGGRRRGRAKREVHGPRWQEVMHVLGVKDITRCHKYDVSNSKVKRKRTNSYTYVCTGCNAELSMGPKRHAKMLLDPSALWHRGCRRSPLVLKGKVGAPKPKAPVARPATTKKAKKGTKMSKAFELYQAWMHKYDRQRMIAVFVNELGMTQAGASTYYYNCQKMYNAGVTV